MNARRAMWLIALTTAPTQAVELNLGLDTNYVFNSNFFLSEEDSEEANSLEFGARVSLREDVGRLQYDLAYAGNYQEYFDQDGVDAWENRLRLQGRYDLNSRAAVHVDNRFRDVTNLRFTRNDIALGDTGLEPNQDRFQRNDLEVELRYDLSSLIEVRLQLEHQFIDFERNVRRSDSDALRIGGEVWFRQSPKYRLGAGVDYVAQSFDAEGARLAADGRYLTATLRWQAQLTSNIEVELFGGPSWIESKQTPGPSVTETTFVGGLINDDLFRANVGSCELDAGLGARLASNCSLNSVANPPIAATDLGPDQEFVLLGDTTSLTDTDVTIFGNARIAMELTDWQLSARYARTQNTTSGDALVSSLDRITVESEYRSEARPWSVYFAGSWERRESLTNARFIDFTVLPGAENAAVRDNAFVSLRDPNERRDATTFLVGARNRFSRALSASIELRYRAVDRDIIGDSTDADAFFFALQLSYDFDPIRL